MTALPATWIQPNQFDQEERLFRHKLRPDWGIGVWVREEKTRRRVCFQDGQIRVFKQGFYHLLEPVDSSEINASRIFKEIVHEHELALNERLRRKAAKKREALMSFDQQLRVFGHLFPGNFRGAAYRHEHRSPEAGRKPLKRHMTQVIEHAADLFNKRRLERLITESPSTVYADALGLLADFKLVQPKDVAPLRTIPTEQHLDFAQALRDVLHGEGSAPNRMGVWLTQLTAICRSPLTWSVATALPAMFDPKKHVCARQQAFELQGRSVSPDSAISGRPNERSYRASLRIAKEVEKRLRDGGLKPMDLVDVRVFIWETLRPKGRKILKEEIDGDGGDDDDDDEDDE